MASRAPWAAHFGLARTPFGKAIAAKDLFARQAHAQATARISFCIDQILPGVITGDAGAGKTVAVRAAVAGLDPTRHQVIMSPTPPSAPAASTCRSSARSAPSPATSKPS